MSGLDTELWQQAYQWVCRQRRQAPANADIWHLRHHWPIEGGRLLAEVMAGCYRLLPMQVVGRGNQAQAQWCARDALVLKWVALQVADQLPRHRLCYHLKGQGGSRGSLRAVSEALYSGRYPYVLRTDIRGYYRHIRKTQVMSQVERYVSCPVLQQLIRQYLHYSVEHGGEFITPTSGICRGCALSPLIGASLLHHVDAYFASQEEVFYARYMDDFLILAPTRWRLRKCIRTLNAFFELGGFERHPDKTQQGRVEKGFDWLGLWFTPAGATVSARAIENHRDRRARLYEQAFARGLSEQAAMARVWAYETRWTLWAERLMQMVPESM